MSSASRRDLMTVCSVSLSLLTTRSWSPWMRTCSLLETFWMRLRRSRAMSSVMPALSCTSIWPRPLPTVFGSPALKSLRDSCRRAGAVFARRLDDDQLTAQVVDGGGVLEIETRRDLAPGLVQRVGELGAVVFGDDVERVLRHLAAAGKDRVQAQDDRDHREGDP